MWFILAIIGYFFLAGVFVLDKLILNKAVNKPVVYTFYSTIYLFLALLLLPFTQGSLVGIDWIWALVSGLAFGFGLWTLFIAVNMDMASRMNPFIGAIITIITLFLSSLFLKEGFSGSQFLGIGILVISSLLIVFTKGRHFQGFHTGFIWGIFSAFLFAISHVSAKYLYDIYPFITAFIWTRATTGIVGIMTLFVPGVIRSLRTKDTQTPVRRHAISFIVFDKLLAVLGVVLIQYAIASGSVTIVNAMAGIQYSFMFLIILLVSRFFTKYFQEKFTLSELRIEIVSLVLVIFGSLFVVPNIF